MFSAIFGMFTHEMSPLNNMKVLFFNNCVIGQDVCLERLRAGELIVHGYDSQVWKGALWVKVQHVWPCQVVLTSTLPLNLYFTNAIFTVWLPDNIPNVKKTQTNNKNMRISCYELIKEFI